MGKWYFMGEIIPKEGKAIIGRYDACPWELKLLWRKGNSFYTNFEYDVEFKVSSPDSWKYVEDDTDEQVKKDVIEAFRISCFLHDSQTGNCAYQNIVRKCDGICKPMQRFKINLEKQLTKK